MIGVQWTGWDGSEWDLRNGPGLFITNAGITGLLGLEADVFTRTSSLLDGQEVTGWKANPRDIVLPVDVSSDVSAEDWFGRQTAFNRTIRPDRYGTLTITDPLGFQRTIRARQDGSAGGALPTDPTLDMGLTTVLNLVADDPWYVGPSTVREFLDASSSVRSFYDGDGPTKAGPPFYLSNGQSTGATTIENVGDNDTWPVWRLYGPFPTLLIDVLGNQIVYSSSSAEAGGRAIADGERLTIDTRPGQKAAYLDTGDGTAQSNVTDLLTTADFAPIPDGASVPVTVLLGGPGRAEVEFEPRYFRAVG